MTTANSFIQVNPDSVGKKVAADFDSANNSYYQVIKMAYGTNGAANLVEDASGKRLPVTANTPQKVATSQYITNATFDDPASVFVVDVREGNSITLSCSGSFVATCVFEGSVDGGGWKKILACRTDSNVAENSTGSLASSPLYGWVINTFGFCYVRVRCTSISVGSMYWVAGVSSETGPGGSVTVSNALSISGLGAINVAPNSSYGATNHWCYVSSPGTNANLVKMGAGNVSSVELSNATSSVKYFKMYNKLAAPTVGTDTPMKTIMIPPNSTIVVDCGFGGWKFTMGIGYALTTGPESTNTTGIGYNEVVVNISFT